MLTKQQAELVRQWLVALRSGEYKQITGCLYEDSTNTYCCLGVLARQANCSEDKLLKNNILEPRYFPRLWEMLGTADAVLPGWPIETEPGQHFSLVYCNDNLALNFSQIADVIQHHFHYDLKEYGYVN